MPLCGNTNGQSIGGDKDKEVVTETCQCEGESLTHS